MRTRLIPFILITMLLFCGCGVSYEVSGRQYVETIGIEIENSVYKIYMKAYEGKSEGDDNSEKTKKIEVIYSEGRTFEEAIDTASKNEGKKIFLGHCHAVVLGKSVKDYYQTLESFLLGNTIPLSSGIICVDKVEDYFKSEKSPDIESILNKNKESGLAYEPSAFNFFESYSSTGGFIAPYVKIDENDIIFDGGVLIKNGDLNQQISKNSVLGASIANNYANRLSISIDDRGMTAGVNISSVKTKITTNIKDDLVEVKLTSCINGNIKDNPYNMSIENIEKLTKQYIGNAVNSAITDMKNYDTDIMEIKKILKKQQPEFYNNHKDEPLFDYLTFTTETKCILDEQIKI